jgi:hypothetical protein
MSRTHTVLPGATFDGTIVVRNTGKEPVGARIRLHDYSYSADGTSRYDPPGTLPRSNADWIHINPQEVDLAPGESIAVYYQGAVPADLAGDGTFWSMIIIEPRSTIQAKSAKSGDISLGIRTITRYGIQIVTHIGDTGSRELTVIGRRIHREGDVHSLDVDVENTGSRMLNPGMAADLYDSHGRHWGRLERGSLRIFPGTSVRYRLDLAPVPAGEYSALIVIDNGDAHVFGARYNLNIER